MTQLYQITLPYACFGVEVERGKVRDAALIARWMIGKDFEFVKRWVQGKKGGVVKVGIE